MTKIFATAASYFQAFPVAPLRGGGAFTIYRAPHVDLRVLSNINRLDTNRRPQFVAIKVSCGSSVVPFEIPRELRFTVRRGRGFWIDEESFYRPVVQHRLPMMISYQHNWKST